MQNEMPHRASMALLQKIFAGFEMSQTNAMSKTEGQLFGAVFRGKQNVIQLWFGMVFWRGWQFRSRYHHQRQIDVLIRDQDRKEFTNAGPGSLKIAWTPEYQPGISWRHYCILPQSRRIWAQDSKPDNQKQKQHAI